MSSAVKQIESAHIKSMDYAVPDLSSFSAFIDTFALSGEKIYPVLFERHADVVQTQKERFAVANLQRIFNATFEISSTSGFDKMSLRDLSKSAEMSMGAIYSCIERKEDIAVMVADIVRLSGDMTHSYALRGDSVWSQLQQSIRFHLYASTVLQPWYFFLYFETRSLSESQQAKSKQIELDAIDHFVEKIEEGVQKNEFVTENSQVVANMILVMLQDWYLKPWKNLSSGLSKHGTRKKLQEQEARIQEYCGSLTQMLEKVLVVPIN